MQLHPLANHGSATQLRNNHALKSVEWLAEQEEALEAAEQQLTDLAERLAALEAHKAAEKPQSFWQKLLGGG